jgi:hypothetical protein
MAHGRDEKYMQNFSSKNLKGRYHFSQRIMLKCILEKWGMMMTGFIRLRLGTNDGLL